MANKKKSTAKTSVAKEPIANKSTVRVQKDVPKTKRINSIKKRKI
jgi:hypothetical protein